METQFAWREEYNIGVDIIDQEHQRLFQIINRLFALREEEQNNQWTGQEGVKFFKEHAVKHFPGAGGRTGANQLFHRCGGSFPGCLCRMVDRTHTDGGFGHHGRSHQQMGKPLAR